MSKFPRVLVLAGLAAAAAAPAVAGDAAHGEQVFRRCAACHRVGEGAGNAAGPQLNDLLGRTAGTAEGYNYSKAMKDAGAGGLVWNEETLDAFLTDPRGMVKGTKMMFPGLKKDADRDDIISYLKTFSEGAGDDAADAAPKEEGKAADAAAAKPETKAAETAPQVKAHEEKAARVDEPIPAHGVYHLGRVALPAEVAAWDVDIRPDGTGLPVGHGTVAEGETIYTDNCASCHGDFGEGIGRWPVLAGGQGTLKNERPVKTVGSYWPYLSTVYDYIRRAMPFGNAHSLSDDDYYALTAYILYLNDIVTDEEFELSKENFTEIHLPNEKNFIDDNRLEEEHYAERGEPCMNDCKPGAAKITMRAQVLDVTPDSGDDDENSGGGIE